MPKSRHKWRYDMEILIYLQNQNMHDKEPREGHITVSSVWSRDLPIFFAKFFNAKFLRQNHAAAQ